MESYDDVFTSTACERKRPQINIRSCAQQSLVGKTDEQNVLKVIEQYQNPQ